VVGAAIKPIFQKKFQNSGLDSGVCLAWAGYICNTIA
jgi:hypothetical protein